MSDYIELSISQPFIGIDNKSYLLSIKNNLINKSCKRLFLLLDISGSMQGERINLVIHACKAIISSSDETIEIAIFVFSSECIQLTKLYIMDNSNKNLFLNIISNIRTNGTTNLLEGLKTTFNYIKIEPNPKLIDTHCIIFTDGEPDSKDINKYNILLDTYFSDSNFNCIIDVFGFGNSLSLNILKSIYTKGKGIFSFISDVNMMATIFNNYLANLFSTTIKNVLFSYEIEYENGDIDFKFIEINDLLSCQEKNFIIDISKNDKIGYSRLSFINLNKNIKESLTYDNIPIQEIEYSKLLFHKLRFDLINILLNISIESITLLNNLYNKYFDLVILLDNNIFTNYTKNLLFDIKSNDSNKGQIEKALKFYDKWGAYYLISICQSHITQTTINFKDESIQHYSGIIANNILSYLDNVFNSIPFVLIELPYSNVNSGSVNVSSNASSYNNRYAGCFDGNCLINIYNDVPEQIPLKYLKSGDVIQKNGRSIVSVQFILKTKYVNQIMYKLGNIIGTSTHPIYDDENNKWIYLKDSPKASILENYQGDYLYSISAFEIKEDGDAISNISLTVSSFEIDNIKCATFGHGNMDKDICDSEYNILCSTFWGYKILLIFYILCDMDLLDNNVLTLENNYYFIRDDNGWCIGLHYNGKEY